MQIKCLRYFLFGLISIIFSSLTHAQGYPNRPITVIVPFSAGSASDVVTRVLLDKVGTNVTTGSRAIIKYKTNIIIGAYFI